MAGRILRDDIDALKQRADIAEIVGDHTRLTRAGHRLKGLCPFHQERTPSFTVDPGLNLYHCLAGETGVMTWEGTFPIEKLAGATHRLLTTGGKWVDAPIRSFGVQRLWAVHLSRNRVKKTLYATDGHRWLLRSDSRREQTTVELRPGDRLAHAFPQVRELVGATSSTAATGRGRSLQRGGSATEELCWVVEGCEPTDRVEEVYCAVVPGTHAFTLEDNILTGNCFGCGAGGDVYKFLQDVEGLTFTEAVEQLARRVGFELRYEEMTAGQRRALGERSRLVAANAAALEFFRAQLFSDEGEVARTYLKGRGFTRSDAERFQIGFAPLSWDALARALEAQRFAAKELEDAGLVARNQRGGLRDEFRGRLVFPVFDLNGDVIGFGGRVLPGLDYGEREPGKYRNTRETTLYHKGRVLYGMTWARPEIVRSGTVLICEGYTDVMALHKAGFTNAVATCGTAVGEGHFDLVQRYAQRVILAFDSDAAGGTAAENAWRVSEQHGLEVRVLVLPEGQDPADVVSSEGPDALRVLVDAAEPVVRFLLRRAASATDVDTPEGKSAGVRAAVPHLVAVRDPVLRDQYARWFADEVVGVSLGVVAGEMSRAGGALEAIPARADAATTTAATADRRELSARAELERDVLRVALQRPELLPERWKEVVDDDFVHPRARAVHRTITAAGGPEVGVEAILEAASDDEVRALIRAMSLEDLRIEPDPPHARMLVARVLLHRLERDIAARKREVERLNPTSDPDDYQRRFEELIALEARRRDLRDESAS